jgi:hypothetical protein
MTRFTPLPPLFALIAAILIADGGTAPSWPCGGFFCAAVPMNQVAERILFAADGSTIGMQVVEVASAAKGGAVRAAVIRADDAASFAGTAARRAVARWPAGCTSPAWKRPHWV